MNNIRHNLAGTAYQISPTATLDTEGCPNGICNGYELTQNLDFDRDRDGSTWIVSNGVYSLDAGDSISYFNTSSGNGWEAIPSFAAIFEGNGFAINNLASISSASNLGLFSEIDASAEVRNLRITRALFKNNSTAGNDRNDIATGILAGSSSGSIVNVMTTGVVVADNGNFDVVGGLVGIQQAGIIVASYATGNANASNGDRNKAGGLVGIQQAGIIVASYATGNVDGGNGGTDFIGGLVGSQSNGSIVASYATGNVNGRAGGFDYVGGLIGFQDDGGSIVANYATGNVDGGVGNTDLGGALIGSEISGNEVANYGFGTNIIAEVIKSIGIHSSVDTAAGLTLLNAGETWNQASVDTLGAWDFGNNSQNPALKFADYDGTDATMFACENNPASSSTDSTILIPHCGLFLAGQSRFPAPRISSNIRLATSYANSQHYSLTTINNFNHKQSFGRVEIYNPASGEFGTVCRDNFDEAEAIVACRSLGFNKGKVLNSAQTPNGTGAILLDDLHCTGTENSLLECQHNGIGIHNCQHSEDVGVFCSY